jgi:Uma2 family endonuclease
MSSAAVRFTSADLAVLPENGNVYEIIEGELLVSRQPSWHHQFVCTRIARFLDEWKDETGLGVVNFAPGVIFADDDDVAPDVVWMSHDALRTALGEDGKLHSAPELAVEVLSPGKANEIRDRETKLKLYSRRGVLEYWVIDWMNHRMEVFRRENAVLKLAATLFPMDDLTSPLFPGFSRRVGTLFYEPRP